MKTYNKIPHAPASAGAENTGASPAASHPDHLKERQKLPSIPVAIAGPGPDHLVPANELEFANFYHL